MAGTTKARGRKHGLDKFYTNPDVVDACLARLDLSRYARIVEPSAGAGAFSRPLAERAAAPVVALDLAPEHPTVDEGDWFAFTETEPRPTLVVGNPPFGQQGSLAMRFLNHAFAVVNAQTVAFILPRSFRKASVQDRVHPYARLVDELVLAEDSFQLEGDAYPIRTVFQVWEAAATPRPRSGGRLTSEVLAFTKHHEPHDFAIRRVGGRAGHAFRDTDEASPQSNYFVRVRTRRDPDDVVALVNSLDFRVAGDGSGPATLAKRELVEIVDAAYRDAFPDDLPEPRSLV